MDLSKIFANLQLAVHSATTARDATRQAFSLGVKVNIDVLDAEDRLYKAQTEAISAAFDALRSEVRLKRRTNELSESYVSALNRELYGETL